MREGQEVVKPYYPTSFIGRKTSMINESDKIITPYQNAHIFAQSCKRRLIYNNFMIEGVCFA